MTEPASRTAAALEPVHLVLDAAAGRCAAALAGPAVLPPDSALARAELPAPAAERRPEPSPHPSGILARALPAQQETHPGASELRDLEAHLPDRQRFTLRHLLKCPPCLRLLLAAAESDAEHASGVARPALALRGRSPAPRAALDLRLARDREAAPALFAALLLVAEADRERLVRSEPRFGSPGLAELLLADAADDTRNHPRQACACARLAQAVAARIDRRRFGAAVAGALAAEARARWAGALWQAGDAAAAAEALSAAAEAAEALPAGAPARAVYYQAAAAIRAGEGRTDEALGLLLRAAALCRDPRGDGPLGECLARLGEVLADLGCLLVESDAAAALAPLGEALDLVDPEHSPWSALRVRQALALALAGLGDRDAACRMLAACRALVSAGLDHPGDQLRYLWTEARILEALGEEGQALRLLGATAGAFAEEGRGLDAALVLLDAVELLVTRLHLPDRTAELAALRALAGKLAKLLPARPQRVLTVALRLANRGEVPAPRLLAHVRDYFRAARRDPARPYAPSRRPHGAVLWPGLPPGDRREICRRVGLPESDGSCAAGEISPDLRDRLGWAYQELTGIEIRWGAGLPSESAPVPRAPFGDPT